jgi:hypothetical protein
VVAASASLAACACSGGGLLARVDAAAIADSQLLSSSPSFDLWRPHGVARLAGRYSDGWLAGAGRLYLWPSRPRGLLSGRVQLPLVTPPEPVTLRLRPAGAPPVVVHLRAGERRVVSFPVCSRGPWHVSFVSPEQGFVSGRIMSAQAGEPRVVRGPCMSTSTATGESA